MDGLDCSKVLNWFLRVAEQNICQTTLISLINVKSRFLILKNSTLHKKSPSSTFIDFLDFFHPPLLVYCIYVLVFSKKSHPPRLFPRPRLLERWEYRESQWQRKICQIHIRLHITNHCDFKMMENYIILWNMCNWKVVKIVSK